MQKKYFFTLISIIGLLSFSACSSSSSNPGNNQSGIKTITGKAIDGYISNATVCLDINKNDSCDENEPQSQTLNNGSFSLSTSENGMFPILVIGGTNTATNELFVGTLKNNILLNNTNSSINIKVTPITTLLSDIIKNDSNITINQAKQILSNNLNLTLSQIDANPFQDKKVFEVSQQIIQTAKLLSKSIQKNENNTSKNNLVFDHVMMQIALSTKDDTTSSSPNAQKIITKLESTLYDGNSILIPNDIKVFVNDYLNEIKIKTQDIGNLVNLDNLQVAFKKLTNEAKIKINNDTINTLEDILRIFQNKSTHTVVLENGGVSSNHLPYFTSPSSVNINENQTSAINLVATNSDNDPLTYNIIGTDANKFNLNTTTGVVVFKIAPDYEVKNSYSFIAQVSDGKDEVNQSVTLNIKNIDDVIPILGNTIVSAAENANAGDNIGNINIINEGDSSISSIVLSGIGKDNFNVSNTGLITLSNTATLDYETTTSYNLTAIANNNAGNSLSKSVKINITNSNEAPIATYNSFFINEDETYSGILTATDVDSNNLVFYKVSNPTNGIVSINSNGAFTYTPTLNYNGNDSFSYKVNDGLLYSQNKTVSISVNSINDTPIINTSFSDISIDDNTTKQFDISISDIDGDNLTLNINSDDANVLITKNFTNPITQADYTNQTLSFILTSKYNVSAVAKITINVSDNNQNGTKTFNTTIINKNITHNQTIYRQIQSPHTGKIWLDKNLGASKVCTKSRDAKDSNNQLLFPTKESYTSNQSDCFGNYYQWGRNFDGHEQSNSSTSTNISATITNVGNNFIKDTDDATDDGADHDWTNIDTSGNQRYNNWNATDGSSICPIGFRVPSIEELKAETINLTGVNTVQNRDDAFNSFLKFPSAGYRNRNSTSFDYVGIESSIWSSTVSGNFSKYLYNKSTTSNSSDISRAYGLPVRCIKN